MKDHFHIVIIHPVHFINRNITKFLQTNDDIKIRKITKDFVKLRI